MSYSFKQNKYFQKKVTNVKVTSVKVKATKVPDDFPALPTKKTKKNNQQTTFTISFASVAGIVLPAKNKNNDIENWTNLLTNTTQNTNQNTTQNTNTAFSSSFDQDDDYDYQSDGSTFDKEFLEEIYLTDDE